MMMENPVNISQERWNSGTYLTIPKENGCLCRPVIIDIRKTYLRFSPEVRDSASRDVELLKKTFRKLGFSDPTIISDTDSQEEDHPLYSVDNLKEKLARIAFGEYGYFYLPNYPNSDQRRGPTPKLSTALLLSQFNGNNCRNLVLKPKIFLVQTCDAYLKHEDKSQFSGRATIPPSSLYRVPLEADILLYHSEVSGGYTSKMKKENRESLGSVIDQGDRSGDGDERETPACQFVFTLYNEVEALAGQQNKFELTDLILGVNRSLMEFIDKEHYRSDEYNKPWNIEPKIPICVDQLTKRLVLGTNTG
uniref:Caspase family p20 domain-containing protein n=1 Tax=Magallana gigas TaxID=29159 RepID=A0A8W8M120_MAGGI